MLLNLIHDREYTFVDEYYKNLKEEYVSDLIKDFETEEED